MEYNKYPAIRIPETYSCLTGWKSIWEEVARAAKNSNNDLIVMECYQGVHLDQVIDSVRASFNDVLVIDSREAFRPEQEITDLTYPDITDDRIFGRLTSLEMKDLLDEELTGALLNRIRQHSGMVCLAGPGALEIASSIDALRIFADMARWEIQQRMRRKEVDSLGLRNSGDPFETLYKRGYFLDWRVCDKVKRKFFDQIDYWLDTNDPESPKLISHDTFETALELTVSQPFSVVPFFDPGPWGGQWMRDKFDLDKSAPNYAWCFNCVPEENSLLFDFGGTVFETPSINTVFFKPDELLGKSVRRQFGEEFPIRFDFLDTIQGGNLSLQVHPLDEYIQNEFNMSYTQDESYYMLDADKDACVYLGLREEADGQAMIADLERARLNGQDFQAEKYSESWPAKKHDHFLIPAGTVHCSGKGCMVLEISATPYIFTFKLWDWGRLGMDGKPRPINIERGNEVIQWDRRSGWVKDNLINRVEVLDEGEDWREERTGLHQLEFIETRRHWHTGKVQHDTRGTVNVLMLVEGEQAIVESPAAEFHPFVVNYAEAFIVPARTGKYSIRPFGRSQGKEIATLKAYVRDSNNH